MNMDLLFTSTDYLLNMRPFHINLSSRKDEEITGNLSTRVVVQSLVLVSKKRFRQDFDLVVRHFAGHDLEGRNMHLLRRTLAYAQQTHNSINKEEFVETFDKVLGRRGKKMSLSFADELYNKGIEKGVDRGKAAIITHCLEERFGVLNKTTVARIKALATSQKLDKISLKLISCQTLREVNELLKKSAID